MFKLQCTFNYELAIQVLTEKVETIFFLNFQIEKVESPQVLVEKAQAYIKAKIDEFNGKKD